MKVVIVRRGPTEYHKVWITSDDGSTVDGTIHVTHDLPHLVVESLYGLDDGLWGSLAAGLGQPGLTDGHLVAKTLTNLTYGKWGDGPATAAELRAGVDAERHKRLWSVVRERLAAVDDEAIELAIAGIPWLVGLWREVADGSSLELEWPLPRSFFAGVGRRR
jgi:hypothetical protein